ncbi:MAG: hypothetical protein HGB11_00725 [Chlorobiales bacterium]|nr:hypothetical protein [Chlorobiales bacterium]
MQIAKSGDGLRKEMEEALKSGAGSKVVRFALASLGGLIPFAGGAVGASTGAWSETEQEKFNKIFASWLKLQEDEIREIGTTLMEVMVRVDRDDERVQERIQSPEYLKLIKKCFRDWSAAESEEKRVLIRNLLSNAAGGEKVCGDDVLSMFINWIDHYNEGHFKIVRLVYGNPGITRYEMWQRIHGAEVREDSPEANLFKLLINDLSLGQVIGQQQERDGSGRAIKQRARPRSSSPYKVSVFDDEKPYELTGLGEWFVHYTMNEIVPKITFDGQSANGSAEGASG